MHRLTCCLSIAFTMCLALIASAAPPLPEIPDRTFSIADHGAVGDGKTISTDAITKAIAAASAAGGGIVVVPPGNYLTGPFDLASKINLRIDEGATLLFTDSPEAYPIDNDDNRHRMAITAKNCTDIAITGKGTIDGQGQKWWDAFMKIKGTPDEKKYTRRPNLVDLTECQRVLVKDVMMRNSPMFHLVPRYCSDVTIDGARFYSPEDSPNTDAIDPSGYNYLITRCHFDVGDDCIAVKPQRVGNGERLSCEDIVITDCTFLAGHGLSVGGQTPGGLRRMRVSNCTFDGTDAGIRLKAARGSGGLVEDVTYENLTMKNVKVPIYITSYYPRPPKEGLETDPPQPVTATTPVWRNIRISNVTIESCPEAGRILGLPEKLVENVVLTNVNISASKGMQIANAREIEFQNSSIKPKDGPPLILHNAEVKGHSGSGEGAIGLRKGSN